MVAGDITIEEVSNPKLGVVARLGGGGVVVFLWRDL